LDAFRGGTTAKAWRLLAISAGAAGRVTNDAALQQFLPESLRRRTAGDHDPAIGVSGTSIGSGARLRVGLFDVGGGWHSTARHFKP